MPLGDVLMHKDYIEKRGGRWSPEGLCWWYYCRYVCGARSEIRMLARSGMPLRMQMRKPLPSLG